VVVHLHTTSSPAIALLELDEDTAPSCHTSKLPPRAVQARSGVVQMPYVCMPRASLDQWPKAGGRDRRPPGAHRPRSLAFGPSVIRLFSRKETPGRGGLQPQACKSLRASDYLHRLIVKFRHSGVSPTRRKSRKWLARYGVRSLVWENAYEMSNATPA